MYRIFKAMQNRMQTYLQGTAYLTQDALAGSTKLTVDDATPFGKEGVNNAFPTLSLKDSATTGKYGQSPKWGGAILSGHELVYIDYVASDDTIILQQPLERDWLVSKESRVVRAPAKIPVQQIFIGEIRVSGDYPTIAIIPDSKTISWRTFSGTMDSVRINFIVYVKESDSEEAVESMLKVADAVEWILMSNLHIKPIGETQDYSVTSLAMVKNVSYGTIQKGSEFLKAVTLTWEADLYTWRGYLTAQGIADDAFGALGTLDNFGPLH